jgi:hypothetical protein
MYFFALVHLAYCMHLDADGSAVACMDIGRSGRRRLDLWALWEMVWFGLAFAGICLAGLGNA